MDQRELNKNRLRFNNWVKYVGRLAGAPKEIRNGHVNCWNYFNEDAMLIWHEGGGTCMNWNPHRKFAALVALRTAVEVQQRKSHHPRGRGSIPKKKKRDRTAADKKRDETISATFARVFGRVQRKYLPRGPNDTLQAETFILFGKQIYWPEDRNIDGRRKLHVQNRRMIARRRRRGQEEEEEEDVESDEEDEEEEEEDMESDEEDEEEEVEDESNGEEREQRERGRDELDEEDEELDEEHEVEDGEQGEQRGRDDLVNETPVGDQGRRQNDENLRGPRFSDQAGTTPRRTTPRQNQRWATPIGLDRSPPRDRQTPPEQRGRDEPIDRSPPRDRQTPPEQRGRDETLDRSPPRDRQTPPEQRGRDDTIDFNNRPPTPPASVSFHRGGRRGRPRAQNRGRPAAAILERGPRNVHRGTVGPGTRRNALQRLIEENARLPKVEEGVRSTKKMFH